MAKDLSGLVDVQRPGRLGTIDHAAIVTATLTPPPKKLGVTHWSSTGACGGELCAPTRVVLAVDA